MKITTIDTNRVREIGQRISKYTNDYQNEINDLFKRLANVPHITKEWVGTKSNVYFDLVALDKDLFIDFGNKLMKFGKMLDNISEQMENEIKNMNSMEKDYGKVSIS